MPKKHVFTEKQKTEIEAAVKKVEDMRLYGRLQVLALRAQGKTNGEVAELTGYHPVTVSSIVSEYISGKTEYLEADGRSRGNNRKLSFEEEAAFLEQFRKVAEQGRRPSTKEILAAYEEETGQRYPGSSIYYLLRRHGWWEDKGKKDA